MQPKRVPPEVAQAEGIDTADPPEVAPGIEGVGEGVPEAEQDPPKLRPVECVWQEFIAASSSTFSSSAAQGIDAAIPFTPGFLRTEDPAEVASRRWFEWVWRTEPASQTDRTETLATPAWPNRRTLATQTADPELCDWYHFALEIDCHVFPNVL